MAVTVLGKTITQALVLKKYLVKKENHRRLVSLFKGF